jgi:DUF1680 family protein
MLRIPGWCRGARLELGGELLAADLTPGAYLRLARAWRAGDSLALQLPLPVRYLGAHRHVHEASGRAAIARGPILYCAEGVDHPGVDPRDLRLPADPAAFTLRDGVLPNGIPALQATATALAPDSGPLYRDLGASAAPVAAPSPLTAIPYFAWANRDPGGMQVWLHHPSASLPRTDQVDG